MRREGIEYKVKHYCKIFQKENKIIWGLVVYTMIEHIFSFNSAWVLLHKSLLDSLANVGFFLSQ